MYRVIGSVLMGLLSFPVLAAKSTNILGDHDFKFSVSLEDSGKVSVSTLKKNGDPLPQEMSVTVYDNAETSQTVQLQAVDLTEPLPQYMGNLQRNVGSYAGMELKFSLGRKSKVLRSPPIRPIRER